MDLDTVPQPRNLLALAASIEVRGVADRLAETISEPDPDIITATAQQLRDIADMLDEGNAIKLRSV